MRTGELEQMGGPGEIIEIDETFIGHDKSIKPKHSKVRGYEHKFKVLTLVSRSGEARSFHVDSVYAKTLMPIIRENIADETMAVMNDDAGQYRNLGKIYRHGVVNHTEGQYGHRIVHTNTAEGFFSIFKRGMKGVYQHCAKNHLHRYLAEFDFRYTNRMAQGVDDFERTVIALLGIQGKRLIYQTTN